MDLIGHFNSLNLRQQNGNSREGRDRSPLRPNTPTMKRFFSPERPPSPRPIPPRGVTNCNRFETTPKRRRFCHHAPPSRRVSVRRLLFDSGSSSSAELMDTIDGINPPRMTSSPLPPSTTSSATNVSSETSLLGASSSGDSAIFDVSLSSTFQFSSTRDSEVQTESLVDGSRRYLINVNPDLLFPPSNPVQQQRQGNSLPIVQSNQVPSNRALSSSLPAPSSAALYKSRLRRTSRSWLVGPAVTNDAGSSATSLRDASVQVEVNDLLVMIAEDNHSSQPISQQQQQDVIVIGDDDDGTVRANQQNPTLLQALECPVCYNYCLPPVTQCRWGHIVCNQCLSQLAACPVCRTSGPGAFVRSIALDSIANELSFPCRYVDAGCQATAMSPSEKMAHELACPYQFVVVSAAQERR